MKRFFVQQASETVILERENHKHLSLVLRARPGDRVVLCPQDGFDYLYEITAIRKNDTTLTFLDKLPNDKEPRVKLTVFFALMKGDKNELVAQKLTELGASEIAPFVSEFCVTGRSDKHRERLTRVCEEAAKQCGRAVIPTVRADMSFAELPQELTRFDLVVFPYEKAEGLTLREYLRGKTAGTAAIVIGSEGGFSEAEAAAIGAIAPPVTLGKRILRAETADIAVTAAVMYELGELQ